MVIGIPKETKEGERRVSLPPNGVARLVSLGHIVVVEEHAGIGCGWTDEHYREAGAQIVRDKQELFDRAELVVKVKEPLALEWDLFRPGQILFGFLHLAANQELARVLLQKGVSAIGCETVRYQGRLILLEPMSRIAGKMAPLVGAYFLSAAQGGCGRLLCGLPGVPRARVVIVGAGTAGWEAAKTALSLGAHVVLLEQDPFRLEHRQGELAGIETLLFSERALLQALEGAELLISTVHVPGARAPRVFNSRNLSRMVRGGVFVDLAIDQGGSSETSRPTTHAHPVYEEAGVWHYCVANMPAAYPVTATETFAPRLLRYVERIAQLGLEEAVEKDPGLREGLQIHQGKVLLSSLREVLGE
ncbi:alanine dehydrogenase [Candidatus Methylacidithermus pantelleriae]|uniref:alanine dehydrogenase n=1 Tax=Candidatus Methylacidithermus pantelleriae TaxID=2744239 RepID=A0A8J2BUZ4_9BACT|nr:alanine dehydrogenase [Candidatus Methylacidithermus pantelleriae]CAF0702625.1 Alanine dehydrogenase [Candidatus Methylacidithermus pantelleriae]